VNISYIIFLNQELLYVGTVDRYRSLKPKGSKKTNISILYWAFLNIILHILPVFI
jgi:hypothetical protein